MEAEGSDQMFQSSLPPKFWDQAPDIFTVATSAESRPASRRRMLKEGFSARRAAITQPEVPPLKGEGWSVSLFLSEMCYWRDIPADYEVVFFAFGHCHGFVLCYAQGQARETIDLKKKTTGTREQIFDMTKHNALYTLLYSPHR